MAKRIAFDARYINDRYHGIGRYAFNLLNALSALAPQFTFVIYRGRWADRRFDWGRLEARTNTEFHPGPWPLYWPQEQIRWRSILGADRVDLFHTPYFSAPLLVKIPHLITVHDLIFDRYPAYMPWAWSRPYYRFLMARSTNAARRIVAVSQATATDLSRFYATPAKKVTVIPEGVDDQFKPLTQEIERSVLRKRIGLEKPFVLTVGARRPHKNLSRLIESFALIAPHFPHDLVLVGPHDERFPDQARKATLAHGLNGRVKFLDWVPEQDLPGMYAIADLVVLPSLVEGFGLPALEAMACGTPVVATKGSSFPEVIAEAGMLVDPYDTAQLAAVIDNLLSDKARRHQLSEAGLKRAAAFTWEESARKILKIYNEVLR